MGANTLALFQLNPDRLHKPAALSQPVARIHINMLAPKAFGAVIGVAIALNLKSAFGANKVFSFSLKLFMFHRMFHNSALGRSRTYINALGRHCSIR